MYTVIVQLPFALMRKHEVLGAEHNPYMIYYEAYCGLDSMVRW
jgi:hypothetical protein